MTLGNSRRPYVEVFENEKVAAFGVYRPIQLEHS